MRGAAFALAAIIGLATGAQASISVASTSTLTTGAVAPPVKFEIGASGSSALYFSPFSLSSNATIATGTAIGRAGGDLYTKEVLRVVNSRAASQSVTVSSTQLTNAQLDVFLLYVYNGTTLIGTLDIEAASPTLTFTLPGSTTYRLDMRLDFADGAGNNTIPASFDVALRVGSGGITVTHTTSAPSLKAHTVVVPFGKLVSGSSVGSNATNASGSAGAALVVAGSTDYFYANNTSPSASYIKLVKTSTTGAMTLLVTMNVGVRNSTGTAVEHLKSSSGSFSQTEGSYMRLEPTSTNYIYVKSLEAALFSSATINFDVYVSDTSTGDSYVVTKAATTLT